MITYIDSTNREKYSVLFDKASIKLGLKPEEKEVETVDADTGEIVTSVEYYKVNPTTGEKTLVEESSLTEDHLFTDVEPITSLNDYFQYITELSGMLETDPYFLRLPLDEPFLEIDGNTRAITVPTSMRQIGVVGDNLAEIVFFKIGRYFDAVDLSTANIYIEWEAPNGDKGASTAILMDTQSEKDNLIFGWAIGPELTTTTGSINFSVRFVKWVEDASSDAAEITSGTGLRYSLGTTRATMTIADTLHYSLFSDEEAFTMVKGADDLSTIIGFLDVGEADSADETTGALSAIPVFLRNLEGELVSAATDDMPAIYKVNLSKNVDGTVFDSMEVLVEAYSDDSGRISYSFLKSEDNNGSMGYASKTKYIEATNTSDTNYILYKKESNDTYTMVAHDDIEAGETYYEKVQSATISGPGYYSAVARNSVSGKKTSKKKSNILYIPYAAVPSVTAKMADHFVINEVTYTESIDATQLQNGVEAVSNIVFSASEMGAAKVTLSPTVEASDSLQEGLTYQWYKGSTEDMADAIAIDGATGATYDAEEIGYYAVKVDNFYNNDHSETELLDAGVCRVTGMPEAMEITNWDQIERAIINGNMIDIQVAVKNNGAYDECTFEWHKVTLDATDSDLATEDDFVTGVPISGSSLGSTDTPAALTFNGSGIATIKFAPNKAGTYYLVLKNKLNGAETPVNCGSSPDYGFIRVVSE